MWKRAKELANGYRIDFRASEQRGNFSPTVAEGGGEGEKKREKRRRKRGKVVKGV